MWVEVSFPGFFQRLFSVLEILLKGLGFFLVKTKNKGLVNVSLLQGQPQNLHQPTNLSNEGE